jgi:hypothetical protein
MNHAEHLQAVHALCDKLRPIIAVHLHAPSHVTSQEAQTIVSMSIASLLAEVFAGAERRPLNEQEHRDFTMAIGAACRDWLAQHPAAG